MAAGPGALRRSCWVYRLKFGEGTEVPSLNDIQPEVREVCSPRHADALLVAGSPAGDDDQKRLRSTYRALPAPKVVLLVGAESAREVLEKADARAIVLDLGSGAESAEEIVSGILKGVAGIANKPPATAATSELSGESGESAEKKAED